MARYYCAETAFRHVAERRHVQAALLLIEVGSTVLVEIFSPWWIEA